MGSFKAGRTVAQRLTIGMPKEPTLIVITYRSTHMKFGIALSAALLATVATASTASAQAGVDAQGGSWQSGWTPGTMVNEYWNHLSDDGLKCNIGYFVSTGYGPCGNQHPTVLPSPLNWTNATYLAGGSPSSTFRVVVKFRPGTYNLSFLGQVAGANPSRFVGVSSADGSNDLLHQFGGAPESFSFTTTKDWQFFMQSYLPAPNTFYSNDANTRQFTVFANSNGGNGDFAGEWLVGAEDNGCLVQTQSCPGISDYDYNDALIHVEAVSTVPEPSTYALMGVGLLAVGGFARRRRAAASV